MCASKEQLLKDYINLDIEIKKLQEQQKVLKEKLLSKFNTGKTVYDFGSVTITESVRTSINAQKILDDYPMIDGSKYAKQSKTTTVTVKSFVTL